MRKRILAAVIGAVVCSVPLAEGTAVRSGSPDGRAIYNFRCYFCHGYSGNAKTVAASVLTPPPADFTRFSPDQMSEEGIAAVLRKGRPGTAMKSFSSVLGEAEIMAVARFVHEEFVVQKAVNTRYHTAENGWPNHERHADAFPFAMGEIPVTQPWESLTPTQARGKRLFLDTCITCHDRGSNERQELAWDARPVSYPRNNFSFTAPPTTDATSGASPYAKHDIRPALKGLNRSERLGEKLFQANCAFCHAADGTGKNWIGSFLEPHPRNLRDPVVMSSITRERFINAVSDGLDTTSMPAWKHVLTPKEISAVADYVSRAFHPLKPQSNASPLPRQ